MQPPAGSSGDGSLSWPVRVVVIIAGIAFATAGVVALGDRDWEDVAILAGLTIMCAWAAWRGRDPLNPAGHHRAFHRAGGRRREAAEIQPPRNVVDGPRTPPTVPWREPPS